MSDSTTFAGGSITTRERVYHKPATALTRDEAIEDILAYIKARYGRMFEITHRDAFDHGYHAIWLK